MKKRKVLFIISSLMCGGAEHALVSLLNEIDCEKYDVDLVVLRESDMFYKNEIPDSVNLLKLDVPTKGVLEPTIGNLFRCFICGKWNIVLMHIIRICRTRLNKEKVDNFWSHYWQRYGKFVPDINGQCYDAAIGYLEGLSNYFCIDKVTAKKKIGWVHTNYIDSKQNKEMDRKYFKEFDYLVTMSEPASETLSKAFPEYVSKIRTIHNVLDEKQVIRLAEEKNGDIKKSAGEIILVSVGNVLPVKGYDMAAEACAKLIEAGKKIKWYIVGRKDQPDEVEKIVKERHIQDSFIMLGMKHNPYSYMRQADIYVQCSRYEGFSTTIREAKILCKPIVATDCQGINDQLQNGINGTLVKMDSDSIYRGILELVDNSSKCKAYEAVLRQELLDKRDTEKEMDKLYQLLK